MTQISALAIFCEDIRQESAGSLTIVGTLADNLLIAGVPSIMPKLGIYVRAHIPVDKEAETAYIYMCGAEKSRNLIGQFEKELIDRAITEAKAAGSPIAGLINSIIASPFVVNRVGRIWLELDYASETFYLGALNFIDSTKMSVDADKSDVKSVAE